jgi:serine protease AprX
VSLHLLVKHSHAPVSSPDRRWRKRAVGMVAAIATLAPAALVAGAGSAGAIAQVPATGTCPQSAGELRALAQQDHDMGVWLQALNGSSTTSNTRNQFASNPRSVYGSMIANGGTTFYQNEKFGKGVDVALIDTGVAPVDGLNNGNVVHGPDLSFESNNKDLRYKDSYGHGTHMASIIAGRDDNNASNTSTHKPYSWSDPSKFTGVAPGARVVSLKVGDAQGTVDVTQVIAAIDWVVKHRKDAPSAKNPTGFNMKVINLSFGIDSRTWETPKASALSAAVNEAWKAGITVVASTGNSGRVKGHGVATPAFNTNIIAVGAYDPATMTVPEFSQFADLGRTPDFVAPGKSVVGLHARGSAATDSVLAACETAVAAGEGWTSPVFGPGGRFLKGSGTSQAAAFTSGAIALILSQKPGMTPDQVKYLLRSTASATLGYGTNWNGQGWINLARAYERSISTSYKQNTEEVVGGAPMDYSRGMNFLWDGTMRKVENLQGACDPTSTLYQQYVAWGIAIDQYCVDKPVTLSGNQDIFGNNFDLAGLQAAQRAGAAWRDNADGSETYYTGGWSTRNRFVADPELGQVWEMVDYSARPQTSRMWSGRAFSDLNVVFRTWDTFKDSWVAKMFKTADGIDVSLAWKDSDFLLRTSESDDFVAKMFKDSDFVAKMFKDDGSFTAKLFKDLDSDFVAKIFKADGTFTAKMFKDSEGAFVAKLFKDDGSFTAKLFKDSSGFVAKMFKDGAWVAKLFKDSEFLDGYWD